MLLIPARSRASGFHSHTVLTISAAANSGTPAVLDRLMFLRLVICVFLLLCLVVFDVNFALGAGYACVLVSSSCVLGGGKGGGELALSSRGWGQNSLAQG